mgnify:CR=1 FL=1
MSDKNSKYIVFDDGLNIYPVVFPYFIPHDTIAGAMSPRKPTSAGFVQIQADGYAEAYGESISLNLKADVGPDSKMLTKILLQITI